MPINKYNIVHAIGNIKLGGVKSGFLYQLSLLPIFPDIKPNIKGINIIVQK